MGPGEVKDIGEIDAIAGRVEAAAGVPGLLAAAWEALEFLRAAAGGCAEDPDREPGLFAAFMFAAAAAAEARDAAGLAPSMPAGGLAPAGRPDAGEAAGPLAERLAGLATLLAVRLAAAAGQADGPGDREALRLAAAGAGQAARLLTGAG